MLKKALLVVLLAALQISGSEGGTSVKPNIDNYATIEAYVGEEEIPVYAFGYTFVYGVSPDLLTGVVMQQGNNNPVKKFQPKKSWEITSNLCGSTPAREPKTMWNDDQPLLPIHLIDGNPETAWSSRGGTVVNRQPEWIRIDLPVESEVSSVVLVCSENGPCSGQHIGKAMPKQLTIKLATDARDWETVYETDELKGNNSGPNVFEFAPRRAKQIWISTDKLDKGGGWIGYMFSVGEVEVRNPAGENLALVSKGAGVQVSSTFYGYGMDRFTQANLWPIQYDLGFKWLRVGYDMGLYLWYYVEREKGKLEIDAEADKCITDAVNNGMKVIMCLDKGNWLYHDPPRKVDWKKARCTEMMETYFDHQGWPTDSPELMEGYLRYVDYIVRHFKGRVEYFEIGNEWEEIGVDKFISYVEKTIPVIKNADPDAKIMLGATSGFGPDRILTCLKASGITNKIDAVSWHPFYHDSPEDERMINYRNEVKEFRKQCKEVGFDGLFASTEWTWAAAYPQCEPDDPQFGMGYCSEMQKAKYSAQFMTAQCGMDVVSLFNETFQTGKIDWDCTLLRNAFSVDPISTAQPQPVYYVLRSISTVLDGFDPAEYDVKFESEKEFDCYTFKKGDNELLVAAWIPGITKDGIVEARADVTLPGVKAKKAVVIDVLNGTEQQLNMSPGNNGMVLKDILVKDFPTFIRISI